jgi:hypothetical protein
MLKRRQSPSYPRRATAYACEPLEARRLLTGIWTTLANPIPASDGAQLMILLPDASVLVHSGQLDGSTWYKLSPVNGSYVSGVWTSPPHMNVQRSFFASNVLPNGNLWVLGGEYSSDGNLSRTAEMYNTVAGTWALPGTVQSFPQANFGDDPTAMLPNGTVLAGYIAGPQTYIYNPATNAWSQTGTKLRNDASDEETWMELPDGSILSYDIFSSISTGVGHAQRYIPATGTWVDAGIVPVQLSSTAVGDELGGAMLLPDGRAFFIGGNNNTAFYTPSTNTWAAGPTMPNGFVAADAPCAMLPNGNVLMALSPQGSLDGNGHYTFPAPTKVYEFNPTTNVYTDVTPTLAGFDLNGTNTFQDDMLVLPNGQVLFSNYGTKVAVYTPSGAAQPAWKPTITDITSAGNGNFTLSGTQFNGISEGASYGDDNEMSENYPLVRIRNSALATSYGRTFNWSSTGVATGNQVVTTQMSAASFFGGRLLSVVASGIASPEVLDVEGTSGADTIIVALNGSNVEVTVNGGGTQLFSASLVTKVFINGLGGNDTILLDSIGPSMPVSIDAGSGDDAIALANASGNLDNIQSAVSIDGGTGSDEIQFDDSVATFSDTYTITSSTFIRNSFPGATYVNAEFPDLFAETGNNTINVNSTASGTDWVITGGNGNDTLNWGNSATGSVGLNLGTASFNGEAGSDTVNFLDGSVLPGFTYTVTNSAVTRTSSATLSFANSESLTLNAGLGSDAINVNTGANNIDMTLNANGGNDTFNVSGAGYAAGSGGGSGITLSGGSGTADTINFNDQTFPAATTGLIASTTFSRTDSPTYTYGTAESLVYNAGNGADVFLITSTAASTPLTVHGGGGDDTFGVGNALFSSSLNQVLGAVSIFGDAGTGDELQVWDSSNTAANSFTVTNTSVDSSTSAATSYATVESMLLTCGSGADVVNLNTAEGSIPITVNAGSGNDTIDALVSGYTSSGVDGTIVLNGEAGTDTINADDLSNTTGITANMNGAVFSRSFSPNYQYNTVESLSYFAGSGGDTINVTGSIAACPITVNAGNGNDSVNLGNGASLNPLVGPVTVNGQAGTDAVTFGDAGNGLSATYTINSTSLTRAFIALLTYGTSETMTLNAGSNPTRST